ncbi:RNA polymerase sigma factor [Streptomyces sp. NPDC004111]|uniref:RNA polymerase sigma factor n=1 Tax=Streptomyces sp. NPDC004111 TaxID=3364690 RepID=UPI003689615D
MRATRWRRRTGSSPPPTDQTDPGGPLTDADLLERIAQDDVAALRALHDRHATWLRLRLTRRCPDADAVEEAVQDTFVGAWRHAADFRPEAGTAGNDAGAWLWTIARHNLVSALRRSGGRWISEHVAREPRLTGDLALVSSAEDTVLLAVEHGELGGALNRLSPELRSVLQVCVVDGLTCKEAAQVLHLPEGTVKSRMRRAKQVLREELA